MAKFFKPKPQMAERRSQKTVVFDAARTRGGSGARRAARRRGGDGGGALSGELKRTSAKGGRC